MVHILFSFDSTYQKKNLQLNFFKLSTKKGLTFTIFPNLHLFIKKLNI